MFTCCYDVRIIDFSGIELSCNSHGVSVLAQSLLEEKHDLANAVLKCTQDLGGKNTSRNRKRSCVTLLPGLLILVYNYIP